MFRGPALLVGQERAVRRGRARGCVVFGGCLGCCNEQCENLGLVLLCVRVFNVLSLSLCFQASSFTLLALRAAVWTTSFPCDPNYFDLARVLGY